MAQTVTAVFGGTLYDPAAEIWRERLKFITERHAHDERDGVPLPGVYVSDIDVWRTVKAAAWIWSGARIGSP
jgi:hypothetical protein